MCYQNRVEKKKEEIDRSVFLRVWINHWIAYGISIYGWSVWFYETRIIWFSNDQLTIWPLNWIFITNYSTIEMLYFSSAKFKIRKVILLEKLNLCEKSYLLVTYKILYWKFAPHFESIHVFFFLSLTIFIASILHVYIYAHRKSYLAWYISCLFRKRKMSFIDAINYKLNLIIFLIIFF